MKQTIKSAVFQQHPNLFVDINTFNTIVEATTTEVIERIKLLVSAEASTEIIKEKLNEVSPIL